MLLGLYGFAVFGWVRETRSGNAPHACLGLLLGVSFYFFGVSGGAIAAARLRLPVMPIVCVLAAAGMVRKRNDPESCSQCEQLSGSG
jgi:hypothetical protein